MLAIVRGLKLLPMERFRSHLQRKDIIRALFLGGQTRPGGNLGRGGEQTASSVIGSQKV